MNPLNQAVGFELRQPLQLGREERIEGDSELVFNFPLDQISVTQDFLDHSSAQPVICGHDVSTRCRNVPGADARLVQIEFPEILSKGISNVADRTNAESQEVRFGVGRVTLEIPMQRAVSQRDA